MAFPTETNSLATVNSTDTLQTAGHAARHNELKAAIQSIRDILGGASLSPGSGIVVDSSGNVSISGNLTNAAGVSIMSANKNLLYNGAMQVAQRGTSVASITTGSYYTVDRWSFNPSGMGSWTMSVENDAPTGSGLQKSTKLLCTSANASPGSGAFLLFDQNLEGQDLQRIAKGTSSAQQLTLSFWVKSNVTGTFVVELYDNNNSRQVSKSYSISASATWERKTLTFPADTTGAFTNDNGSSLTVRHWLGAGSTYTSGTLNSSAWAAPTNANRASGISNLAAATNNYWQITGVQLEVGPVATSFEFKSYQQELRECMRYWQQTYAAGTAAGTNTSTGRGFYTASRNGVYGVVNVPLTVIMRAAPTVTTYRTDGTASNWTWDLIGTGAEDLAITVDQIRDRAFRVSATTLTTNRTEAYGHWTASAEL